MATYPKETPSIQSSTLANTALLYQPVSYTSDSTDWVITTGSMGPSSVTINQDDLTTQLKNMQNIKEISDVSQPRRRIVQVFIVDPDEDVPIEKALLYKGEQQFTDLTDQELFFELDIKDILTTHNSDRTKIVNKELSRGSAEKVYLEPAKIRDLTMNVVTLAEF